MYQDLILKYREFDLESALSEIQDWISDLNDTYEDHLIKNVLENVKELICDNCVFD